VPAGHERPRHECWLRATVAYDGTDFSGFQIQRSRSGEQTGDAPRTVQGVLEGALAQILQKTTSLLAAGRTDSGVHAIGQVVAFGAEWGRPLADLHRGLNAVLPEDVAILDLAAAPPEFHPRYDALSRTYCYTVWNHPVRSPLMRRKALWARQPLDLAAMDDAAQFLVGSHDFCTFGRAPRAAARKGEGVERARLDPPSTVRCVKRARWGRVKAERLSTWPRAVSTSTSAGPTPVGAGWQGVIEFTIEANAFLYRMVRSIVGTLIQVGLGHRSVSEFGTALYGVDRSLAGPTAAPQGLCLMRVIYPGEADEHRADEHCADTEYRADAVHRQENQ
jgi:tRNA pseudouridine38-40 synthase